MARPGCQVSTESPSQAPPVPMQGLPVNTADPQVWPGGAPGEGKSGQQLGPEGRAQPWPGGQSPEDGVGEGHGIHPPHAPQGLPPLPSARYGLQEDSKPLAFPRDPPSQTGVKARTLEDRVRPPPPCRLQETLRGTRELANEVPGGFWVGAQGGLTPEDMGPPRGTTPQGGCDSSRGTAQPGPMPREGQGHLGGAPSVGDPPARERACPQGWHGEGA